MLAKMYSNKSFLAFAESFYLKNLGRSNYFLDSDVVPLHRKVAITSLQNVLPIILHFLREIETMTGF